MNYTEYENLAIELRRELHKIPEIAYEEFETSDFILNTLKGWGIDTAKKVFNTGVTALFGDEKKPCIAFRADIDGLPVTEQTGLPFASTHKGKMHACGHDGHAGVLLAFAKLLKDNEDKLDSCVKLIFQPAEEGSGGAEPMIKEGVLQNPVVEKIFGFHLWPDVPSGKVEYSWGASFAEAERYEIHIKGNGGHGAMPEKVKNCLFCAAEIIEELKKVSEKYPKSIVSACSINSTGFHNIFADSAVIRGTIRTVIDGEREKIEADIKKACEAQRYGCEVTPQFVYEYPCAVNHENELKELISAASRVLGEENVYAAKGTFAAEDFAFYTQATKGAHIKVGTGNPEKPATLYPLHNPKFDIDENALKTALKIFAEAVFK